MTTYDEAIGRARGIGEEHAKVSVEYWEQNIFSGHYTAQLWLDGIESRDEYTLAHLPIFEQGGYTLRQLAKDCRGEFWCSIPVSDLSSAYEDAFSATVEAEIVRVCREAVSS